MMRAIGYVLLVIAALLGLSVFVFGYAAIFASSGTLGGAATLSFFAAILFGMAGGLTFVHGGGGK